MTEQPSRKSRIATSTGSVAVAIGGVAMLLIGWAITVPTRDLGGGRSDSLEAAFIRLHEQLLDELQLQGDREKEVRHLKEVLRRFIEENPPDGTLSVPHSERLVNPYAQ